MPLDSTAIVIPEDDEQLDERLPVIVDHSVSSASLPDVDSDTSSSVALGKRVRSRVRIIQPDPSSLHQQPERFQTIKNWEGVVTSVEGDSFFASMRLTNSKSERAEDEFEIDIDNVARGDRDLVREGAIFYLTVGIRRPRGEGPQKTTRIIFRRMPRWSSRDIERGEAAATELWEKLRPGLVTQGSVPQSEPQ